MDHSHLRLEELNAQLVSDSSAPRLLLAIQSLALQVTREGLQQIISTLIPDQRVTVTIDGQAGPSSCRLTLQALQWGLSPRIHVSMEPFASLPGSILINITPGSRWSVIDRAMVGIATHNLDSVARKQPEIQQVRPQAYRLDLQRLIRERLIDNGAPVRWDARLEGIHGTADEIRIEFVHAHGD